MYFQERLCVPHELIPTVVIAHHAISGHLGVDKLVKECSRRYVILDEKFWKDWSQKARRYCTICVQCDPPTWQKRGKIGRFPILPSIWDSIAIDIFSMPSEEFEGRVYNAIIICVDRHSGWVIAIPTNKIGLTSEKVGKLLYYRWLDLGGGIPSIITSDQGPQFTGKFFAALCSLMGIRQAFTQAYRAQANGRAERAGRQILDRLSKLNVQGEVNWVEALPKVLEQHHDAEGESGMSPYNIIFGRHRHRAGIPQQPPRDCEDAQAFLQRME